MPSFQGTRKTNFLRSDDNKHELFLFLGHRRQVIILTILDGVVSCRDCQNTDELRPCSHEEADTRISHELRFEDGDDKNS